jgi:hypothetical protein
MIYFWESRCDKWFTKQRIHTAYIGVPMGAEKIVKQQIRFSWKYFSTIMPVSQGSDNATPCYDCIIPSMSNVTALSMGLHKNIAKIHSSMLEHAVIKTHLGISTGSYSYLEGTPVFGTGQGSTASPPFWLLNCSSYFTIYESKCYGAQYVNMDGSKVV